MRLLVVEDEKRIANSIKKGLEQEQYAVDVAYDGQEGYDLAASESYDLLILDRMLPGMEGKAICSALRSQGIKTPILMLTAKSQTQDKVEGLDAGADDYLTKPFAFEELLARIRALIRRPPALLEEKLQVENLVLNTHTGEVTRGKQIIHLSGKEYAIFVYLLRNRGTIVSKQQIIDHVWDFDADVLPNTVEVNMRNIRNKIEKPFTNSPPLIQTIRGFGYKIA